VLEKVERLWTKGGEFFFHDRFMDDVGLRVVDPQVLAKVYLGETGLAVAIWNTTGEQVPVDVAVDLKALGRSGEKVGEVVSLDEGASIHFEVDGSIASAELKVPPNDIDALVSRRK